MKTEILALSAKLNSKCFLRYRSQKIPMRQPRDSSYAVATIEGMTNDFIIFL